MQKNIKLAHFFLLLIVTAVLTWSGFNPKDRFTWIMEVAPVFIGYILVFSSYNRFRLTDLLYFIIAIHCVILCVGGRYTYAEVPAGFWAQEIFGFARNHYDRLGHFAQGFIPAILAREILVRHQVVKNKRWLFLFVTSICLSFSAVYEFIEWAAAITTGEAATAFLGTQGDVWDTQWDMFMALVGALTAQMTLAGWHDRQILNLKK